MHNPYEFCHPRRSTDCGKETKMVPPRQAVGCAIEAFVNQHINSDELCKRLAPFIESPDLTAKLVASEVCFQIDDSAITATKLMKSEWNQLQRYLLLLSTDCRIVRLKTVRQNWTQVITTVALLGFLCVVASFGLGKHLLFFGMPFGVLSISMTCFRARLTPQNSTPEQIIAPFKTFSDLKHAYKNCTHFTKRTYPRWMTKQNRYAPPRDLLLSRFVGTLLILPIFIVWAMHAPFTIFFQRLPISCTKLVAVAN